MPQSKVQENFPQKTGRKNAPRETCIQTQFSFKILTLENQPKLQEVHFQSISSAIHFFAEQPEKKLVF